MRANKGKDTRPELAVRRSLHAMGLRYRVNARPIPSVRRTADVVFTKQHIVVFIDGCFWHKCPKHYTVPKANADYWRDKVEGNRKRDEETNRVLRDAGWTVLRFWEHEDPDGVAARVYKAVMAP